MNRSASCLTGAAGRMLAVLLSTIILLAASPVLSAQSTTGNLTGTVLDETGAVVADAKITVMSTSTGYERLATTNAAGEFAIVLLQAGDYVLTVEMPGFRTITVEDIEVRAGFVSERTIKLMPVGVSEVFTVTAGSEASSDVNHIDITSATLKYSIQSRLLSALPVWSTSLGRNSLGVLPFLVPGVNPVSSVSIADASTNRLGSQMSINGARPTAISFNLDGGENNDYELNRAAGPMPNPDAVREFSVATNAYKADQGQSSGGIVDAAIRSGTNRFHGGVRHFLINEALNARGFFDLRAPLDKLNTFGAQLGGPIVLPHLFDGRGRTFFFADYEGTRYRFETTASQAVPSLAERSGDFGSRIIYDPVNRRYFEQNRIPAGRFDPRAVAYLDRFIPLPNDGDRSYRRLLPTRTETDQVTIRLDHKISDKNNLSATVYSVDGAQRQELLAFPVGSRNDATFENLNVVVRATHVFSSACVNEATATFYSISSTTSNFSPEATGRHPSELGFNIKPQTENYLALPEVRIGNMIINPSSNIRTRKDGWQVRDDLTRLRGTHGFKFGGEYRKFAETYTIANNNGQFIFSDRSEFAFQLAFPDFLLGLPFRYYQTTGSRIRPEQSASYVYALDDWRLTPNLTLNLGIRYEMAAPFRDKLDQVAVFRPGFKSERFPNAPSGMLFVGDPDPVLGTVPRTAYPADKNNVAPRFGIAYSPAPQSRWLHALLGENKTALKAGMGVYYDHTRGLGVTQFSFVQPFSTSQTLTYPSWIPGAFADPFFFDFNRWPLETSERFTTNPPLQTYNPSFKTARSFHLNFTIQRELSWGLLAEASYVGTKSANQERQLEVNVQDPFSLRPDRREPGLGSVVESQSIGQARYDSFQLRVSRRGGRGLGFDASYVYGKALDDASDAYVLLLGDRLSWGRSPYDRKHNLVFSYTYDIPTLVSQKVLRNVLEGWQLGGITEFRSGQPLEIVRGLAPYWGPSRRTTVDLSASYVKFNPKRARTIKVNGIPQTGNFFFDPNSFHTPGSTQTSAGSLGRNVFDGPGVNLWSVSLSRQIHFAESKLVSVRADVRNLFNRPHFYPPVTYVNDAALTFGQIKSAAPGRNIQMVIRFSF